MTSRSTVAVVIALAGCGIGYRRVLTTDELPAGTCPRASLTPGESCTASARDYSAGLTVGSPHQHATDLTGTAWFRWPLFDVSLDTRMMRRSTLDHRSVAGGVGSHFRPTIFWPRVQRYLDVVVNFGFELGVIHAGSHVEGRGDAYVGAAIDLFAPDFGQFRYTKTGIPGLRAGVRYTGFVQDWDRDITFELGLIWRWGVSVDLYRHWTTQRTGD